MITIALKYFSIRDGAARVGSGFILQRTMPYFVIPDALPAVYTYTHTPPLPPCTLRARSSCGLRTRSTGVMGVACPGRGCQGRLRREYTDKALYDQLKFYETLFDVDRALTKVRLVNFLLRKKKNRSRCWLSACYSFFIGEVISYSWHA